MSFGQYLIDLRTEHGLGRKKLHQLSQLSLSYLHYIENDKVLPGPDNLRKIAAAIRQHSGTPVPEDDLLQRRDRVELQRMGFADDKLDMILLLGRSPAPLTEAGRAELEQTIHEVLGPNRRTKRRSSD